MNLFQCTIQHHILTATHHTSHIIESKSDVQQIPTLFESMISIRRPLLFTILLYLWLSVLATVCLASNDLTQVEWHYDPSRDNRGGWAQQRGITTRKSIDMASDLRLYSSSQPRRRQLKVLVYAPAVNVKSGGLKVLYKLVHDLNTHGAEAYIIYTKPNFPRLDWIDASWKTPVISTKQDWANVIMDKNTILLLPETPTWQVYGPFYAQAKRNGALCGRLALNYYSLWPPSLPDRNYSTDGTDFVLCDNDYTADLIARKMGTNTVVLPTYINANLYHDRDVMQRLDRCRNNGHHHHNLIVAYVSRKSNSGTILQRALESKYPNVEWIPMHSLPEPEYAAILRRAHVYVATGKLEGLNLSILEAWAAGALVVGFHGYGASLSMVGDDEGDDDPQNAIVVVPNGNDEALIAAVDQVLANFTLDCTYYHSIIQNAHRRLQDYTVADEEKVAQFVTDLLMGYRFGFPFPSHHLWVTNDHSNDIGLVVDEDKSNNSSMTLVWMGSIALIVLMAWYFFASNTKKLFQTTNKTAGRKRRVPKALLKDKRS